MLPSTVSVSDAAADSDFTELLGPALASALATKGYTTLTPVQQSVLDPALADRDLRISSQTGSGKTLAIGFALRDVLAERPEAKRGMARPRALVIVPTRELARQVQDELGWLYAPLKLRIAAVIGGSSYRDEHRALAQGPAIVVGTPGRLLDHLKRGAIDPSALASVVLDEADRMLDLGFREDLEAILALAPEGRRTHLVSATFPREVKSLADRVQTSPVRVEGTPLGSANADIDHIVYLVSARERVDALVNVLLHHAEEQTLVFARTRADVAEITRELQQAGFAAGSLSGEMDQPARLRALAAFRSGQLRALVATDVAARGIDVQDIARVVQIDAPTDADTYTHRSGRTGRAGRKGTSALLVPPSALRKTSALLQRAGVRHRVQPVPSAAVIRATQDERLLAELSAELDDTVSERVSAQVARIIEQGHAERVLTRLLVRAQRAEGEPRDITPLEPVRERERERERERSPRTPESWVPFRVTFGEAHGADARKLVAMLCRRGNVRGSDLGAIRVERTSSTVEVAARLAAAFAEAVREPDPRNPRVFVTPLQAPRQAQRDRRPPKAPPPQRFSPKTPARIQGGNAPPKRRKK
ncbi:MAG TPA: DEAD/DEAH box helicase [Polyangiaceae bacterium]|nr:DEAD/DEAH box helicase [Polyangiaceae bacterium]